ncbi:acidic proline-rich protein PRP25-like [Pleurodeles waltl]|uniref:acidic proline-rich protein PRP25-like n=1 Tax=Pleurodeles waltl TaxID=8319 RepID=UPI003709AD2F
MARVTGERPPAFTLEQLESLVDGVLPLYGQLYGPPDQRPHHPVHKNRVPTTQPSTSAKQSAAAPIKSSAAGTKRPQSVMAATPTEGTHPAQKGRTRVVRRKGQETGTVEATPSPGGKDTSGMSKANGTSHKRGHMDPPPPAKKGKVPTQPPMKGKRPTQPPMKGKRLTPPAEVKELPSPAEAQEPPPPAQAQQPSPLAEALEPTPPAQAQQLSPPAEAQDPSPPAQAQQRSPPAEAQEPLPPAQPQQPSPPAEGM